MKCYYKIIFIFLISLSCRQADISINEEVKYSVYYFHPTARCESCLNIEDFTRELVETKFSEPNKVIFIPLNIDEPQNAHFMSDFNLKFSSVVITRQIKGVTGNFKNLDSIWTYSYDKEGFFKYADSEIREFIKQKM